jgi:hypothetical protein
MHLLVCSDRYIFEMHGATIKKRAYCYRVLLTVTMATLLAKVFIKVRTYSCKCMSFYSDSI